MDALEAESDLEALPLEMVLHIVRAGQLSLQQATCLAKTCPALWEARDALRSAAQRYSLVRTVPPASEETVAAEKEAIKDYHFPSRAFFAADGSFFVHIIAPNTYCEAGPARERYPTPGIDFNTIDADSDLFQVDIGVLPEELRFPPLCLGNPDFYGWLSPERENRYIGIGFYQACGRFFDRRDLGKWMTVDVQDEYEGIFWMLPANCISANCAVATLDGEDYYDDHDVEDNATLDELIDLEPSASPDLKTMAGVACDGALKIYDTSAGFPPTDAAWTQTASLPLIDAFSPHNGDAWPVCCWSEDSRRLAALHVQDGAAVVFVVDLDPVAVAMTLHGSALGTTLAFSPDGRRLVSGGETEFTVFDLARQEVVARLPEGGKQVAWSVDGHHIVISTGLRLRIYSA